jgi:hypothetical protein
MSTSEPRPNTKVRWRSQKALGASLFVIGAGMLLASEFGGRLMPASEPFLPLLLGAGLAVAGIAGIVLQVPRWARVLYFIVLAGAAVWLYMPDKLPDFMR